MPFHAFSRVVFLLATIAIAPAVFSSSLAIGISEATAIPAFSATPVPLTFRAINGEYASQAPGLTSQVVQSEAKNVGNIGTDDAAALPYTGYFARSPLISAVQKEDPAATRSRLLYVNLRCGTQFNITSYTTSNYVVYSTEADRFEQVQPGQSGCMARTPGMNSGDVGLLGSNSNLVLIIPPTASSASKRLFAIEVNFN